MIAVLKKIKNDVLLEEYICKIKNIVPYSVTRTTVIDSVIKFANCH